MRCQNIIQVYTFFKVAISFVIKVKLPVQKLFSHFSQIAKLKNMPMPLVLIGNDLSHVGISMLVHQSCYFATLTRC